jgi:hypothetical protein
MRFLIISILSVLFSASAFSQQNVTVAAVDPADRLTGSTLLGEWATDGVVDGWSGTNVTSLVAAGGFLSGSAASITLGTSISRGSLVNGPDLDLGFNDYLQIRLKLPASYVGDVKIEYGTSVNPGFAATRQFVIPAVSIVKDGAFHTYRLELGLEVFWRDALRDLRLTPLVAAIGDFQIDYVEIGDVAGTAPTLNLVTNFKAGLSAANTNRMESKHICVWSDPTDTTFTSVHARRVLRMCEESYQVFCRKLGYNEPFREFDSTTTPRFKLNFLTWYDGYWAGGFNNRAHMNVGTSGLGDEGSGNPVPHEFGHCIQMAQPGRMVGGHWESHANYLRAERNLHFYAAIPNAVPALDNLTGNSNYRPDHSRNIYADQRYYLSLDDYGTQFGLPTNYAATMWRDGAKDKTLIEKLATSLPGVVSVKDVACESCKRWPMLDFVEKTRIRAQHWGNAANRAAHFWRQGAQLIPLQDKPGWWRVPLERAPDRWAYQMHDLTATAGATVTAEIRGLDLPGTGEDWRWCFAAISSGDAVRYSPVYPPGAQSFSLMANETQVFLIVTATPSSTSLDLDSHSNTKPVDKNVDRLRYAYEVRLVNAAPAAHPYVVANPANFRTHSNGGGVVGPSATVDASAYVGPNAKVIGTAKVLGTARIEDYVVVQGSATVQGTAVVSGSALIEGTALVEGEARVRDRAHLTSGAVVRGRALISGYTGIESCTITDDAIVRGCANPFGGTVSGTAILDHDYSMQLTVNSGVYFSHVPFDNYWNEYYGQTLRKPRGLIASYRTEEGDGEEWWDEFGALHAQLRGAPVRTQDAQMVSSVMSFDGIDDYALLDRSVADTSRFSFSAWIKPATTIGTVEPILVLGSSATKALKMVRNATGKSVFTLSDGSTTRTLTSTSTLTTNEWKQVALTLDGSTATLFINGVAEASTPVTLTPLVVLAANNGTAMQGNYIGYDGPGKLFKGSFEDVRFYNVAMTAAEVRAESLRRGDRLGQFSPSVATDFNGSTSTNESGVRNGRVRTLSAWVKPRSSDDVSNYEAIFDSTDERFGRTGSGLGLDAGKWVARLENFGNWATNVSAVIGKWQHVALAFNGTSATLFINGTQVATRTYSAPALDSGCAGKCFRLGYSQTTDLVTTRQYFDGQLLNARISDRALSASQLVLDSDGDGVNDNVEIDLGTNPLDPLSLPPQKTVSGKVTTTNGVAIAGATVYFSDSPNASSTATITTTTDSTGNYSRLLTAGTWYVVAAGSGYNAGTERSLVINAVNFPNTDFSLVLYTSVSGRVTQRSGGAAIAGASVYFSRSPFAASAPAFTATTNSSGDYTQVLPDGIWYLAAGNASSYTSTDKSISLAGNPVAGIHFSLIARSVPLTSDLLFSALTESLPVSGSTGNWPSYLPSGQSFTMQGSPSVESLNGAKWVRHLFSDADGFRVTTSSTAIPVNGVSVVLAVKPQRSTNTDPWTSLVDIFYNRVVLGIRNSTGNVVVHRNGTRFNGPVIPDGQSTILSLVMQPTGTFKVFGNGVEIMSNTSTNAMTSLVPNVPGTYANAINIGRNNPDTWTTFNGLIGDVFVYKVALTDLQRQGLEANLLPRFVNTEPIITASTSANGTINPTGSVPVPPGGSQVFTFTPQRDYILSGVLVNGVAQPLSPSYTFTNVTSSQTISATFSLAPNVSWKQTNFGGNASNPLISGDYADPDADSVVNLLEYAAGTSPLAGSTVNCTSRWNGTAIDFTYPRNPAATDLVYTVEWSDSLTGASWSSVGVSAPTPVPGGSFVKVTVATNSGITKRFIRLRVTLL